MGEETDPIKALFGLLPSTASRRNVAKIITHYFLDYASYFTYNPVYFMLQYIRSEDLRLILFMNIGYLIAAFLGSLVMAAIESKLKLHPRLQGRIVILMTLMNMLFLYLSTTIDNKVLAVVSCCVTGFYFSGSAVFFSSVFIGCIDIDDPEKDYHRQFLAQSASPLVGSAAILVLVATLGNEWDPAPMKAIVYGAAAVQVLCIAIVASLSYDHVVPENDDGPSQVTDDTSTEQKWVPWVALLNNCCRDIIGTMMWAYFPYYAVGTLGLEPLVVFGTVLASQGLCICFVILNDVVVAVFNPYVRIGWLLQILIPLCTWLIFFGLNRWPVLAFLFLIVIQDSVRDSPGGALNATIFRYASPEQRELFGGLLSECVRLLGWLIGTLFGGYYGDVYGFEATVLPTAVVGTVAWLVSLVLIAAPLLSDKQQLSVSTELARGCSNLRALAKLTKARDRACGTVLMMMRFKRVLMKGVERRRSVASQRDVTNPLSLSSVCNATTTSGSVVEVLDLEE
jgi:hypothetical protein